MGSLAAEVREESLAARQTVGAAVAQVRAATEEAPPPAAVHHPAAA